MAKHKMLQKGGEIWLPNVRSVDEAIARNLLQLEQFYDVVEVSTSHLYLNPLYAATDLVNSELLLCEPSLHNENQIKYLTDYSTFPFYLLRVRDAFASPAQADVDQHVPAAEMQSTAIHAVSPTSEKDSSATSALYASQKKQRQKQKQKQRRRLVVDLTGEEEMEIMVRIKQRVK
jgi:hypothetical protein